MLSFRGGVWLLRKQSLTVFNLAHLKKCIRACFVTSESTSHGLSNSLFKSLVPEGVAASKCIEISINSSRNYLLQSLPKLASCYSLAASGFGSQTKKLNLLNSYGENYRPVSCQLAVGVPLLPRRCITTAGDSVQSASHQPSASVSDVAPRIKFKRLDKTARHITQIIDKEAIEEVRAEREIPDIKPGYIVQLRVEVPENKRRVSILKGIVIARRNAGFNTTFRIRRLVAGVGVESLFHLYSPNIKEIKVLDKKKVRRAKLYYLRDKMNALKKQ